MKAPAVVQFDRKASLTVHGIRAANVHFVYFFLFVPLIYRLILRRTQTEACEGRILEKSVFL